MRRLIILSLLPLLSGCGGMLVSAGAQTGVAIAENRSIGRKIDDTVIYTDLTNQFVQANKAELLSKVTFNVRFSRVMLTGQVKSEADGQKAVELSWKAKGVTEVINELVVNPNADMLNVAEDALIKRNLEGRLLITKGVWVINYSIDVQNGVAYLIGRVRDQDELNRALNVSRTTKGVKRVVSHLQVNPDTTQPVTSPNGNAATLESRYPDPSYNNPSGSSDNSSNTSDSAPSSAPAESGGSDIYTGPVYGGGSISSSPTKPANGGY